MTSLMCPCRLEYSYNGQVAKTKWVWHCCRQPWWCEDETAQIHSHMYTEALYFSHPLAKSNLLRPFYDSLTKLWSMEITFPWLDIPLSCSSRPTSGDKAGLRRRSAVLKPTGNLTKVCLRHLNKTSENYVNFFKRAEYVTFNLRTQLTGSIF